MTETKPRGKEIIELLGGVDHVSKLTGRTKRQVYYWRANGIIPEDVRSILLRDAASRGLPHHPFDYVAHLLPIVDQSAANKSRG
jgi:hypothetical protein